MTGSKTVILVTFVPLASFPPRKIMSFSVITIVAPGLALTRTVRSLGAKIRETCYGELKLGGTVKIDSFVENYCQTQASESCSLG